MSQVSHFIFKSLLFLPALAVGADLSSQHSEKMKKGLTLFSETIRPALEEHCLRCHGGEKVRSGLNLATRELLLQGGDSGSSIDLENPTQSYLLTLLRHEEEPTMPPKGPPLSPALLTKVEEWISLGAPYDKPLIEGAEDKTVLTVTDSDREFWSFRPLLEIQPPSTDDPWVRTEIDRFIAARHKQSGLHPNSPAKDRTLVRRAYLDLLGLPPTPEEIDAFQNDSSPRAWENLLDRLLASPHYGERQARYWMDVARFAESFGFEQNYERPSAYHYRDFLIQAFQDDMPWNQMVSWQLAGDELAPKDPRAWMATGFLVAGVFPTQITEAEFEQARYDELDDMVATTGAAFLGLSIGCARCHDHKYDPIPVADYYELTATFATAIRSETLVTPLRPDLYDSARSSWENRLKQLDGQVAKAKNEKDRKKIERQRNEHFEREPKDGQIFAMICSEGVDPMKNHADGRGYPHFYPQVHHLERGSPKQKQEVAEQGFLQVLMPAGESAARWQRPAPEGSPSSHRRSALAAWITDDEAGAGHLLARVIVNRIWQQHFGTGLVATPNDFGLQGEPPTHPELLDWLARDLIAHGWRLKRIHKQIMTSAVYRQSAEHQTASAELDLKNKLLWRFPSRRLQAEPIRDSLLTVAGMLDRTPFGPGSKSESMNRRSIYFTIKRSELPNAMVVFDWPEHLVSIGRRPTTTVAPQSLYLMNNPQVRLYAEGLARRAASSVEQAYQIALGRAPSSVERKAAAEFLTQQGKHYPDSQAEFSAFTDFCQALMGSNEFLQLP